MANIDNPRGLVPYGNLLRTTEYTLSSGYAQNLFIGDPVIANGTNRDVIICTEGTTNKVLGAIVGIYDVNKVPLAYWPTGNTGIGYVTVADHPDQLFVIQEDAVGANFDINACNGNVNLESATAGSTVNYRSGWELDSSDTPGATAGDQIRLVKPLNVENNAIGANCAWICRINNHQAAAGIVGAGV